MCVCLTFIKIFYLKHLHVCMLRKKCSLADLKGLTIKCKYYSFTLKFLLENIIKYKYILRIKKHACSTVHVIKLFLRCSLFIRIRCLRDEK